MSRCVMLVLLLVIAVGCKGAPQLAGTWTSTSSVQLAPMDISFTFGKDGAFKAVSTATTDSGISLVSTDTGTWKLDGDKLTTTITDVDWEFTGGKPGGAEAARKRFAVNKKKILERANEHPTSTIKWNGPDEFSIDEGGQTQVFHRAK